MNILLGCECSGRVRDAFLKRGHNAISCDLKPSEIPGPHIQGDVFAAIASRHWDAGIFFPDCTFLTCSAEWAYGPGPYHQKVKSGTLVGAERIAARQAAQIFFLKLWGCNIEKIAIENPIGVMSRLITPTQIIQPYNFNNDASKATCLWLRGLPKLIKTNYIEPRVTADGKKRWGNQTDTGQNRLAPGENRAADRSRTYLGIAAAMADQWG